MPKRGVNVALNSYDDIFGTDESREEAAQEKIQQLSVTELHPFTNHPFKVLDDEAMAKMVESIKEYGVLVPVVARPLESGGYEIISGHRRHHAAELAGVENIPVIVREMDDDTAVILMVDSNLQRENILPSERAFSYKMKLEAMKHQGERADLVEGATSRQVGEKLESPTSVNIMSKEIGESERQIQRFIRLTNLIPELLDKVDAKQLSFNPAVELSYLTPEEQKNFMDVMEGLETAPSLSQTQRLKRLSQEGRCSREAIEIILEEDKKAPLDRVVFDNDVIRRYFPKSYTKKQMEDTILKLLDQWQKKREREAER